MRLWVTENRTGGAMLFGKEKAIRKEDIIILSKKKSNNSIATRVIFCKHVQQYHYQRLV